MHLSYVERKTILVLWRRPNAQRTPQPLLQHITGIMYYVMFSIIIMQ